MIYSVICIKYVIVIEIDIKMFYWMVSMKCKNNRFTGNMEMKVWTKCENERFELQSLEIKKDK